jgi:PKD repeat protein
MQAPYNLGRTFSHETGHWLGLRHVWGDANCGNDYVDDTPTQQSASSGCPTGRFSCGTTNMVENYMDYSNDACMHLFTVGQNTRMQAAMQLSPRRKAVIQANLCAPIVAEKPVADFTSDKVFALLGGDVTFTDLSSNFPTKWAWTFEGGDPATSTDRNPKVTYNTPGTYKVTLVASNSLGNSDPLERDDYITVSEHGLCSNFNNFIDTLYTPSFLRFSDFGAYTGYLTGTSSVPTQAVSEFFNDTLGYKYISGVKIKFGHLISSSEDASINVTVWNARGPLQAPGSIIETKTILLQEIQADITAGKATEITFARESPVEGFPFQVGVEFNLPSGDTLAVESSANGEATNLTSWIRNGSGIWKRYGIDFGANIAMNIEPIVGMHPSVQVSTSDVLVYPGQPVTLNGHGASIFVWSSSDGSLNSFTGPQVVAHPVATTTYMTIGSGLQLCQDTTYTTVYVRGVVSGISDVTHTAGVTVYPNPGTNQLNVDIENDLMGTATVRILSSIGLDVIPVDIVEKTEKRVVRTFDTSSIRPGLYLVVVNLGGQPTVRKWVKY